MKNQDYLKYRVKKYLKKAFDPGVGWSYWTEVKNTIGGLVRGGATYWPDWYSKFISKLEK